MQKLHVVGFTTDLEGLILTARKGTKSGGYTVSLEGLLAAIEEGLRLRTGGDDHSDSPRDDSTGRVGDPGVARGRQSGLSPREIQARLRAGRSLVEVASEARVDEAWVWRFAAPVLAERAKVIGRGRALTFTKPRRGASAQPLGTSVRWAIADRGVRITDDEYDLGWSAAHLHDQVWVITFAFLSRGRPQRAEWQLDLREGNLLSLNRLASALGYVDPGRRSTPSEEQLNPEPDHGYPGARGRRVPTKPPATAPTGRVAAGTARSATKRTPSTRPTTAAATRILVSGKALAGAAPEAPAARASSAVANAPLSKATVSKAAVSNPAGLKSGATASGMRATASKGHAVKSPAVKSPAVKSPAARPVVDKELAAKALATKRVASTAQGDTVGKAEVPAWKGAGWGSSAKKPPATSQAGKPPSRSAGSANQPAPAAAARVKKAAGKSAPAAAKARAKAASPRVKKAAGKSAPAAAKARAKAAASHRSAGDRQLRR